jgi:predicted RNase H-like HicB family nuclease
MSKETITYERHGCAERAPYTISVVFAPTGCWCARSEEFPGYVAHGDSPEDACGAFERRMAAELARMLEDLRESEGS